MRVCAILSILLCCSPAPGGEPLRAAVASNFAGAFDALADDFSVRTGIEIERSYGSTGKLYAQIRNGAPFDVFLAADVERPSLLEASGRAETGSRFTYAVGRLAVWSRSADDCLGALRDADSGYVAIANPELAPYGRAAGEYLAAAGIRDGLARRLVYGENVSQAFAYAASGNAIVAIVSLSHSKRPGARRRAGCVHEVPAGLHAPIEQ
ncbi:MAG: molybdate ABC transporter substrate-binding protein, partial [Proteobacteria bacterium]|nr:molybdate ABC transporter substrate-binding protein [Pseudomonadota bacterium]